MSNSMTRAAVLAGVLALGATGAAQAQGVVPGKPGTLNIVDTAKAENARSGEFTYLLAAASWPYFDEAVVNLLSGSTRYTLFAPTDAVSRTACSTSARSRWSRC